MENIDTEIINYFTFLKIVEIIGVITGIIYVIGAVLEKKWCWYYGIIAVISYAISTYFHQLYGEFALQFYYLGISFYGLYQWSKKDEDLLSLKENLGTENILKISHSSVEFLAVNTLIGALLSLIIYYFLNFLNSSFPILDSITSGYAIVATYMTTKKKIENWYLWIIIDLILCPVLYLKGMPFYSTLYIVYAVAAIIGLIKWRKEVY